MQALACEAVYWPGLDANISNYVKRCAICTRHKASPPAQLMLPRDTPSGLWQGIMADYFHHSGKDYLLIANLFSKYHLLFCMTYKTAQSLVQKFQKVMSQYGSPVSYTLTMVTPSQPKNSSNSCRGRCYWVVELCQIFMAPQVILT